MHRTVKKIIPSSLLIPNEKKQFYGYLGFMGVAMVCVYGCVLADG